MRFAAAWAGATLTTLFFSEFLFWNEGVATFLVHLDFEGLAVILGYYAFCALVLAAALSRGASASMSWPVWVIAGCLFGWTVEGAVVPATYEAPPLSFLWTAIAWHMPIDVLWGVWLLPRILAAGPAWAAILACLGTGAFWGFWTTWIWVDTRPTPEMFAQFALSAFLFAWPGLWLLARFGPALPTLWPGAQRLTAILALCLFVVTGSVSPIWAALLVAIVVGVALLLPRKEAQCAAALRPVSRSRTGILVLIPVSAIIAYALCHRADFGIDTGLVAALLMIFALGALAAAGWRRFTSP